MIPLNTSDITLVDRTMKRLPLVTLVLVALNLLAYLLELAAGGPAFCQAHGFVPARFMRDGDLGPALSSMFLHDPAGLVHLGGNMVCLAAFGAAVERALGSLRFTVLYFAAGVGGALAHAAVCPHATDALVGASGAIFGVLAAAGMLYPRTVGFVGAYAAFNIVSVILGTGGSVAVGAHVGGFVVGYFLTRVLFARTFRAFRFEVA